MANFWEIWCKSIGEKAFLDNRKADKVAILRTIWVLFQAITCCFIIAGVVRHWDKDVEVVELKCYLTYHGIEHCVTEEELNESRTQ